jgi:hypothetical protein
MDARYPADAPPSPQVIRTPPWPGALVHFRAGHPVYVDPHRYEVDEPADLRCSGCRANSRVIFDPAEPGIVAFCADHDPGCQVVADLIEMAARP